MFVRNRMLEGLVFSLQQSSSKKQCYVPDGWHARLLTRLALSNCFQKSIEIRFPSRVDMCPLVCWVVSLLAKSSLQTI